MIGPAREIPHQEPSTPPNVSLALADTSFRKGVNMRADSLVPAAQYLRMSTEHQQYSLENQSLAIQKYAELHGFDLVQTYTDSAKSGVVLRLRTGLQQLLQDVVRGTSAYRAILVYDVRRWGRFQDTDESAHYEFLCKSAGVPVHYCAETFANDGSLPSLIMKALKRTMAGEYSRELGVKVLAGQKRLALLGFKQGGSPGYGLRRLLVSADRIPKQTLAAGERKSIATDRVILAPGPEREIQVVKDIFRMLVSEKRTVYAIARELNRRGAAYLAKSQWDYQAVYNILTHPKYCGCHLFGRTSRKLYTPTVKLPRSQWVVTPGAYEPIIDSVTFDSAQKVLEARTFNKSDDEVLDALRGLLAANGRLSLSLIQNTDGMPSPSTYRVRFGSLRRAYQLIGYACADRFRLVDTRYRILTLREQLLQQINELFGPDVTIVRPNARWRGRLRFSNGVVVSVLICKAIRVWKETIRWQVDPIAVERKFVTLIARLNENNTAFLDYYVLPQIKDRARLRLHLKDRWLRQGQRLTDLPYLRRAVERIASRSSLPQMHNR
jgi:DNA invertase Pin-like site-specific DNA recombinase